MINSGGRKAPRFTFTRICDGREEHSLPVFVNHFGVDDILVIPMLRAA